MVNDEVRAEEGDSSRAPARKDTPSVDESCQLVERSLAAALRAQPGLMAKLVRVIDEGLDATKVHYDIVEKRRIAEPDFRVRLDTAKLAMAYLEGLPVQTVVGASVGDGNLPRLADALRRSPNARRVLEGFASRLGPVVEADQESPVESAPSAPSVAPAGKA